MATRRKEGSNVICQFCQGDRIKKKQRLKEGHRQRQCEKGAMYTKRQIRNWIDQRVRVKYKERNGARDDSEEIDNEW